jgi:hypothetical protein
MASLRAILQDQNTSITSLLDKCIPIVRKQIKSMQPNLGDCSTSTLNALLSGFTAVELEEVEDVNQYVSLVPLIIEFQCGIENRGFMEGIMQSKLSHQQNAGE